MKNIFLLLLLLLGACATSEENQAALEVKNTASSDFKCKRIDVALLKSGLHSARGCQKLALYRCDGSNQNWFDYMSGIGCRLDSKISTSENFHDVLRGQEFTGKTW